MKEKTTGKWKLRVIAGVLSMGMMFPAGVLSQGWTVNAVLLFLLFTFGYIIYKYLMDFLFISFIKA